MLNEAAIFVRHINEGSSPRWLSFVGASGTGKTHLAKHIWNWFSKSKHAVSEVQEDKSIIYAGQWVHWPDLAEDLRAQEAYGRMSDLRTEKFVVLDEIGAARDTTGFVTDALCNLLCSRAGKWTIITSNSSPDELAALDTRIVSRMVRDRSVMVQCDTTDYALRKKK